MEICVLLILLVRFREGIEGKTSEVVDFCLSTLLDRWFRTLNCSEWGDWTIGSRLGCMFF